MSPHDDLSSKMQEASDLLKRAAWYYIALIVSFATLLWGVATISTRHSEASMFVMGTTMAAMFLSFGLGYVVALNNIPTRVAFMRDVMGLKQQVGLGCLLQLASVVTFAIPLHFYYAI